MIHMKTVSSFALSRLTDGDLSRLLLECSMEQARREEARKARRKTWIRDYHSAFLRHPNATYKVLGETVVVSVYDRCTGIHMSSTTPCGEDKFELSTGIAVAFAKAMGERIPNYI
jgi:hypothetical protein